MKKISINKEERFNEGSKAFFKMLNKPISQIKKEKKSRCNNYKDLVQKRARRIMREALKDESLRIGYIANIAVIICDSFPEIDFKNHEKGYSLCNEIAEKILKVIFD